MAKSIILIFSICYGLAMVGSVELYSVCVTGLHYTENINDWFSSTNIILCIATCLFSYILINFFVYGIQKATIQSTEYNSKSIFMISFFCNMFVWTIYWLAFFPGTGIEDGIYIIENLFYMRSQHPALYIALSGGIVEIIRKITGSIYWGVAVYSFIQMIIMSMIISYCIQWFARKKMNRVILISLIVYYSCTPIISNYSISFVKDTLFSSFVMLSIILFYDILNTKGECLKEKSFLFIFLIMCVGMTFIRNNGLYILLVMFIILFFTCSVARKKLCMILVFLFLTNSMINIGVEKLSQESYGIPIQQIAATVAWNGDISDENIEIIEELMPLSEWKRMYNPVTVDSIKWGTDAFNRDWLNQNEKTFLKVWFDILKDNFSIYLRAYGYQTYGLWNTLTTAGYEPSQSIFFGFTNNTTKYDEYLIENNLYNLGVYPSEVQSVIASLCREHTNYLGAGVCFWIMLAMLLINLCLKAYKKVICFFPPLLVWCTLMLAAPISFGFRYSFYYVLCLPVLFAITVIKIEDKV